MASGGIDVRMSSNAGASQLDFTCAIDDGADPPAAQSAGTCTMMLAEVQDDMTLHTFDFSDNNFKSGAITTLTASVTHRTLNNGGTNSGVWTARVQTLTNFEINRQYLVFFDHSTRGRIWDRFIYGAVAYA